MQRGETPWNRCTQCNIVLQLCKTTFNLAERLKFKISIHATVRTRLNFHKLISEKVSYKLYGLNRHGIQEGTMAYLDSGQDIP